MTKTEILQKLVMDMEVRGRSPMTIHDYATKVRLYQDHYDKPASELGEEDIINYLHYLATEKKITPQAVNTYNSALRFLYGVTLDTALNYKKLPRMKHKRSLPQIYTKEEVCQIIDSAETLIHKAMLMLAYGSGLRLSEIVNLKITDIESKQMRIFIRSGKGDRDRYAMLPEVTLATLREYWKAYRPTNWLFEAPKVGGRYHVRTLQDAFKSALRKSGIKKPGTIHTLRHCFATHLYEDGHNLLALKKLLGHVRIDTTAWYTQLAYSDILSLKSPIDNSLAEKYGNPRKVSASGTKIDG
jgi:site-specific recombinase XerD